MNLYFLFGLFQQPFLFPRPHSPLFHPFNICHMHDKSFTHFLSCGKTHNQSTEFTMEYYALLKLLYAYMGMALL